jgi:sensor histidine kinase YesM
MIARLGDLLRQTLDNAHRHEATVQEEVAFLEPYLEIERARIGPRLQVTWDIDPDALAAQVPYLVLQPLVENAIVHGIAPHPRAGRLEIRAERQQHRIKLQVSDDGPGLRAGDMEKPQREGVGLANTRARLEQMYGTEQSLELRNGPGGGLTITISLPYRAAEPARRAGGWKRLKLPVAP